MSRRIELDEHVYERLDAFKRDDESFGDAIERLLDGASLRDLRSAFDEERVSELRSAVESAEATDREAVREVADRFD